MTERERRSWGGGRLKSCLQSCKSYRLAKAALIACHMLGLPFGCVEVFAWSPQLMWASAEVSV